MALMAHYFSKPEVTEDKGSFDLLVKVVIVLLLLIPFIQIMNKFRKRVMT